MVQQAAPDQHPDHSPQADTVAFTLGTSTHLKIHLLPHHAHSQALKIVNLCTDYEENPSINILLSPHFSDTGNYQLVIKIAF